MIKITSKLIEKKLNNFLELPKGAVVLTADSVDKDIFIVYMFDAEIPELEIRHFMVWQNDTVVDINEKELVFIRSVEARKESDFFEGTGIIDDSKNYYMFHIFELKELANE